MAAMAKEKVAFVGGGISAIAAAHVWQRCGYEVVVYEASDKIGGQWTQSYPQARVQNTAPQYQFAEFPWPFEPDRHPTKEQVLQYIHAFVKKFEIPIQCNSRVTRMTRPPNKDQMGWIVTLQDGRQEHFDCVQIATGQFHGNNQKHMPLFQGLDEFQGTVLHNLDASGYQGYEMFDQKRVAIIGFGKTALDFCAFAAPHAKQTTHIFRTPRWTIPDYLLGIDFSIPFFTRLGSEMMPSWHQSWLGQRFLHTVLRSVVDLFWCMIARLFWFQYIRDAKLGSDIDRSVLDPLCPPLSQYRGDLRSATLVAPPRFYEYVSHGLIQPKHSAVSHLDETGIVLESTGEHVDVDIICMCCGNDTPTYPFLPQEYQNILDKQTGGPSLYRFAIDPRIPDVGFCGINSFMHLAVAHLSALWQIAVRKGDIQLPSNDEMLLEMKCVSQWKSRHTNYEPIRNLNIDARFQQMADLYCNDLGVAMFRKLPNLLAEVFERYDPTDYKGVIDEYLAQSPFPSPRRVQPMTCVVDTKNEGKKQLSH